MEKIFIHVNKDKIRCPRCGRTMVDAQAINTGRSTWWLRCSLYDCKTFVDTNIPLPHQANIMKDPSSRVGVFGGFGSGKTHTNIKDDEKHIMITSMGETLIGAATLVQLENTIRKDFERDFPGEFVKQYNRQKNMITFVNGHLLYWRHLAEIEDIRSYNLTRAHFLEASGVKQGAYVQIQTRLRNEAGIKYYHNEDGSPVMYFDKEEGRYKKKERLNWIKFIAESNPDANWIKDDILLKSGKIVLYEETEDEYEVEQENVLPFMTSHIIPTKANIHLPGNFFRDIAKDKPEWWIKRYLKGSFRYSEGLVYPEWQDHIIEDFAIPDHWPRIIGYDYGLSDNSHFVFGGVDINGEVFKRPCVFWFDELVLKDMSVSQLASEYKQKYRRIVPSGMVLTTPRMDPVSYNKRNEENLKTIGNLFLEEGCYFLPGEKSIDFRILHLGDMIKNGYHKFFRKGFARTNKEALNYKFPEKSLDKKKKTDDKPEDKLNHGVNAIEFITSKVNRKLEFEDTRPISIALGGLKRDEPLKRFNPLTDTGYGDYEDGYDGHEYEGPASLFHDGGY